MLNFGILGAGKIAGRFAESLARVEGCRLYAISARNPEKAEAFASRYPVEKVYIGHEQLLEDKAVKAVYLSLPHGLHREWAVRALSAGKAVLCEKPAALDAREMREIAQAARDHHVLFMEAMKTRFVPAYRDIRERIVSGEIGRVMSVDTSLCCEFSFDEAHPTYHTEIVQGGCLLDEGIYCACWLEDYLDGPFSLIRTLVEMKKGVDFYVDAHIDFGGRKARLECSFNRSKPRQAVILGTGGRIIVDMLHRPEEYVLEAAGREPRKVRVPYEVDDFYSQIRHFSNLLLEGKTESPVMPLDASLRCAEILDCIRKGFPNESNRTSSLEYHQVTET